MKRTVGTYEAGQIAESAKNISTALKDKNFDNVFIREFIISYFKGAGADD